MAASFSDVECSAPLAYRATVVRSLEGIGSTRGAAAVTDDDVGGGVVSVDRDLLVMTGGIVPLTQRHRCADGFAFVELLKRWKALNTVGSAETGDGATTTLHDVDAIALLDALQLCKASLSRAALEEISPLILSLTQSTDVDAKLFYLLESLEVPVEGKQQPHHRSRSVEARTRPVFAAISIAEAILEKGIHEFLGLERAYRALNVIRKGYTCKHNSLQVTPVVERLCSMMDFAIQANESDGNPMQLDGDTIYLIRSAAVEARVRCLAMEMADPFEFVTRMDQLLSEFGTERSFAMHHEVIQAFAMWADRQRNVALSDAEAEHERTSASDDSAPSMDDALAHMVQTLRTMVEVRPRGDDMDVDSKAIYQHSHALVLTALCGSHDEKWLSEGYLIVVTHKYHQLSIDVDTIRPLIHALSKRGDCRVFNLVDLVTLYCNNKIDFNTVEAMFRTCRVAGDFHRAKALYQLMKETVPGFLAKAPVGVVTSLRELKVIKQIPPSMFDLAEDGTQPLLS